MKQHSADTRSKSVARKTVGRPRQAADARGQRTRARLIDIAGQTVADQGFDGTTGQDICRRAGVNTAAIVYHFGSLKGLHQAVLKQAQRQLVSAEVVAHALKAEPDPKRQLEVYLGLIIQAHTSGVSQSWAGRLFAREFITPSVIYGQIHDRMLDAKTTLLKAIVGRLTGRAPDDPVVACSCINIMAPCAVLLLFDPRKLRRLIPDLDLRSTAAPQITRQLVDFALGGLGAIQNQRRNRTRPPAKL